MSRGAKIFLFLLVVFLAVQLVPVERTNPTVTAEVQAPAEVAAVLERSCYDCHSNETDWPWYSRVAPASWLVSRDVEEARSEVNFSEWGRMSPDDIAHAGEEIVEVMEEEEMPLWYYTVLHPRATLNEEDRAVLAEWGRRVEQGVFPVGGGGDGGDDVGSVGQIGRPGDEAGGE